MDLSRSDSTVTIKGSGFVSLTKVAYSGLKRPKKQLWSLLEKTPKMFCFYTDVSGASNLFKKKAF